MSVVWLPDDRFLYTAKSPESIFHLKTVTIEDKLYNIITFIKIIFKPSHIPDWKDNYAAKYLRVERCKLHCQSNIFRAP
jgi:hypothetical protein